MHVYNGAENKNLRAVLEVLGNRFTFDKQAVRYADYILAVAEDSSLRLDQEHVDYWIAHSDPAKVTWYGVDESIWNLVDFALHAEPKSIPVNVDSGVLHVEEDSDEIELIKAPLDDDSLEDEAWCMIPEGDHTQLWISKDIRNLGIVAHERHISVRFQPISHTMVELLKLRYAPQEVVAEPA